MIMFKKYLLILKSFILKKMIIDLIQFILSLLFIDLPLEDTINKFLDDESSKNKTEKILNKEEIIDKIKEQHPEMKDDLEELFKYIDNNLYFMIVESIKIFGAIFVLTIFLGFIVTCIIMTLNIQDPLTVKKLSSLISVIVNIIVVNTICKKDEETEETKYLKEGSNNDIE